MKKENSICAVIVSYEPDESIIRLYNSIKEQVNEIIIVDNASSCKQSKDILESLSKEVKIIYNDKNYGIAKALNQGAKYAIDNNYKWLLTLDQDSEFIEGTYKLLLSAYDKLSDKNKIMLIAPQYKEKIYCTNSHFILPDISKIKFKKSMDIITSGSLIKITAFDLIGLFEEKLFIDRVDFDFCIRIQKKGYICIVATNILFCHELAHPKRKFYFKNFNYSELRRYYIARNSVYLFKNNFFYAPFKMTIALIRCGIFFASVRILLFEKDKFKKIHNTYKGFIDGILNKY